MHPQHDPRLRWVLGLTKGAKNNVNSTPAQTRKLPRRLASPRAPKKASAHAFRAPTRLPIWLPSPLMGEGPGMGDWEGPGRSWPAQRHRLALSLRKRANNKAAAGRHPLALEMEHLIFDQRVAGSICIFSSVNGTRCVPVPLLQHGPPTESVTTLQTSPR